MIALDHPAKNVAVQSQAIKIHNQRTVVVIFMEQVYLQDKFRTPQHFTENKADKGTLGGIPEKRDERADVIPSFVSGYKNGKAIYSFIRVVPENIVSQIEDDIVAKEQVDRQTSDSTLFDPADNRNRHQKL